MRMRMCHSSGNQITVGDIVARNANRRSLLTLLSDFSIYLSATGLAHFDLGLALPFRTRCASVARTRRAKSLREPGTN